MILDPNKRYDVVYQRQNAQNHVVAAITFPCGQGPEEAGAVADGIGEALRLKRGGWPHSWLTIMPTDSDESVFLVECTPVN